MYLINVAQFYFKWIITKLQRGRL